VAVQTKDSIWRRGTVIGMRNDDDRLMPFEKNFEVQIPDGKHWDKYYCEDDIYGPGFNTSIPIGTKLLLGQQVYVTHEGREVKGTIKTHHSEQDLVSVKLEGEKYIFKTLEEIRLLESRKSARLGKSVLDFSKLAEMGYPYKNRQSEVPNRRRLHSMSSFLDAKQDITKIRKHHQSSALTNSSTSDRIDVPSLQQQSRKRRTSESVLSDAESGYLSSAGSSWGFGGSSGQLLSSSFKSRDELRDCTAAMVLMNLSTSPLTGGGLSGNLSRTCTPHSSPVSFSSFDEEEGPVRKCARSVGVMYKCTWRGCTEVSADQTRMERHVRGHLGRSEPLAGEERDMEEEFYYEEIELDVNLLNQETQDILDADFVIDTSENSDSNDTDSSEDKQGYMIIDTSKSQSPSSKFTSLSSEARSSKTKSEKPQILAGESLLATSAPSALSFIPENSMFSADNNKVVFADNTNNVVFANSINNFVFHKNSSISEHLDMVKSPPRPSYSPPATSPRLLMSPPSSTSSVATTTMWNNPKKLVSIIPKPENTMSSSFGSKPFIFSPPNQVGLIRSDKKCRKLYGLEQKDMWCTQCKWKKACARFQ